VALGLVHPDRVHRNADGRAGDVLVLGKPLGVGILSAALKKGRLDEAGYAQMLRHTTQLNRVGASLGAMPGVRAMTDVTGFGLAGHLLEVCRGSGLDAEVALTRLPLIEVAAGFAREGIVTGASGRQLGGLRCRGDVARAGRGLAAGAGVGSADQRWPAGELRPRGGGRRAGRHGRRRLW